MTTTQNRVNDAQLETCDLMITDVTERIDNGEYPLDTKLTMQFDKVTSYVEVEILNEVNPAFCYIERDGVCHWL